ncbi:hypothetical protein [Allomuricauda sp. CAU 1633]|uniref:hypothetical protein n=1 Tax=Allomuricauda sp. CAU 1633 TaxID=2816036 RepID=UPI001A8FFA72|nr:hypothetical protein [Muricauda sp. CAU 1633]
MSRNDKFYRKSCGICFIEISNANEVEAKLLRGILDNEAKKINPDIEINFHDARFLYNEPKKLHQEID